MTQSERKQDSCVSRCERRLLIRGPETPSRRTLPRAPTVGRRSPDGRENSRGLGSRAQRAPHKRSSDLETDLMDIIVFVLATARIRESEDAITKHHMLGFLYLVCVAGA